MTDVRRRTTLEGAPGEYVGGNSVGAVSKALVVALVCATMTVACSSSGGGVGSAEGAGEPSGAAASTTSPSTPGESSAAGKESKGTEGKGSESTEGGSSDGTRGPDEGEGNSSGAQESGLPGLGGANGGPLVKLPLPEAATAQGSLVAGYPPALRPGPRSRTTSSSVSPAESTLQVALTATSKLKPDRVLRTYRIRLGRLGFQERPTTAVGGSSAAAFKRGNDSVVVTASPRRSGSQYSVFGTLHAAEG
jgi:hypothetical protein